MKHLTPVLAGFIAGVSVFFINFALLAVPIFAAQIFNTKSNATSFDALITAINLFVLGHGGTISLSERGIEGAVKFIPLGILLVFFLNLYLAAKKLTKNLPIFNATNQLRPGSITLLVQLLIGFVAGYSVFTAVLSLLGQSSYMAPSVLTTFGATVILSLLAGVGAFVSFLQKNINILGVTAPYLRTSIQAAGLSLLLMLSAASISYLVANFARAATIKNLYQVLDADLVGNVVLTLGQLALVPNLIIWTLVIVLGGTVLIGLGTGISLDSTVVGVLPLMPALGVIPEPGSPDGSFKFLLLLPFLATVMGAIFLAKRSQDYAGKNKLAAWLCFAAVITTALGVLAYLAKGYVGNQQLAVLGPDLLSLIVPLVLLVFLPSALIALGAELKIAAKIKGLIVRGLEKPHKAEVASSARTYAKDLAENTFAAKDQLEPSESTTEDQLEPSESTTPVEIADSQKEESD